MKRTLLVLIAGCFLVALSSRPSLANSGPTFIQKGTMNGVHFLSGGVGLEERAALQSVAKDYDLRLVFAMASGPYLADVRVEIQDSSGKKLVETTSEGPWFFAKVPEGQYKITVAHNGQKWVRRVEVGPNSRPVEFWWKS